MKKEGGVPPEIEALVRARRERELDLDELEQLREWLWQCSDLQFDIYQALLAGLGLGDSVPSAKNNKTDVRQPSVDEPFDPAEMTDDEFERYLDGKPGQSRWVSGEDEDE